MAQYIKPTAEMIDKAVEKLRDKLSQVKTVGPKLELEMNFDSIEVEGIVIRYTPFAWVKQVALIMAMDTEVAWHGVIERDESGMYIITDILVYPQKVTGATVNTDDESYARWMLTEVPDELSGHLRCQMHSHVNMAVSPSGTDLIDQQNTLSQFDKGFYCFMIWNKRFECNCWLFDMDQNIKYENEDITVGILGEDLDLEAFLKSANDKVSRTTYPVYQPSGTNYTKPKQKKSKSFPRADYYSSFWDE